MIFLLSNRVAALVSFWPFGQVAAWPLGALVLVALVLGFLLGLAFHLPHRFALNRRAKRAENRAAELEARNAPPPPVSF
ncbi:LapA family protein [Acidocella sp.]|uniref:LapA family protein n=1 Tax=Acidocella sp. TaxID=50710 RepID=UPI00263890EA|nr:LapA family protein [Acidocella sp.]MDD2795603.1 LapA family protein [Acidocella sp.]